MMSIEDAEKRYKGIMRKKLWNKGPIIETFPRLLKICKCGHTEGTHDAYKRCRKCGCPEHTYHHTEKLGYRSRVNYHPMLPLNE